MQRLNPFFVFGATVLPIILLFTTGCGSHQATVAVSPQFPTVEHVVTNSTMAQQRPGQAAPDAMSAIIQQDSPPIVIGDSIAQTPAQAMPVTDAPSETSRKAQVIVGRLVDVILRLDGKAWLGLAVLSAMLFLYALEDRSAFFSLAFATACWTGSVYGVLQRWWLIVCVGGIWGCLALQKWWRRIHSPAVALDGVVIWPVRVIGILAVISGLFLLVVDSPLSARLPMRFNRAIVEAIPLLLVGIAYVAWLAIDRPPIIDLIKQIFIAVAFILWGINLLMPPGQWTRFVGAVVIAIYVFDLAWLMEGNLRKRFGVHSIADRCVSTDCQSSGICACGENDESTRKNRNGGLHGEIPTRSIDK